MSSASPSPGRPLAPDVQRARLLARLLGTPPGEAYYIVAALAQAVAIDGDVCEFGVAQGETSALIASEIRDTGKTLHLFDSFEGLPTPSDKDELKDDIFALGSMAAYAGTMSCPEDMVRARLAAISFPPHRYVVHKGFIDAVIDTDRGLPQRVSFAYVDFDFYEPTKVALEYLDGVLAAGATVVVDDYDFFSTGAKTAVDEFVAERAAAGVVYDSRGARREVWPLRRPQACRCVRRSLDAPACRLRRPLLPPGHRLQPLLRRAAPARHEVVELEWDAWRRGSAPVTSADVDALGADVAVFWQALPWATELLQAAHSGRVGAHVRHGGAPRRAAVLARGAAEARARRLLLPRPLAHGRAPRRARDQLRLLSRTRPCPRPPATDRPARRVDFVCSSGTGARSASGASRGCSATRKWRRRSCGSRPIPGLRARRPTRPTWRATTCASSAGQ